MAMFTAFSALVRKDLVLHFSNRRALIIGVLAPIVMASFFGFLFDPKSARPSRLEVVVSDEDPSTLSRQLVQALQDDPALKVTLSPAPAAREAVRAGRARAALVLPGGLAESLPAAALGIGPRPTLELLHDPSQPMALPVIQGALAQALSRQAPGGGRGLPFELNVQAAAASGGQPYNSYAHAFAGMGVQFILFAGIDFGIGVLLARRLGLWRRLRVAPIGRGMLLGSRMASGALIAFILMLVIFAAAMAIFGVRIQGSVLGFVAVTAGFALMTSTFGMLIAAFGRTPEATRGLAVFATLVMVMLGGAWVPSFLFPGWMQTLSLALPTRWAVDGFDAMTWRGQDLAAALPPTAALLGFALLFGLLAVWRFDWEE
jgi:ABC-2 type transport system permease protein